jgi:hypothetical protein
MMPVVATLSVALLLAAESLGFDGLCPTGSVPQPIGDVAAFPGIPIGANYSKVKSQIPRKLCPRPHALGGCRFLSREGYWVTIQGGDDGATSEEPFVASKDALRAQRPWLPFGVTWSDNEAVVVEKLRKVGVDLSRLPHSSFESGANLRVGRCLTGKNTSYYEMTFQFDAKGRLMEVSQWIDWL